MNDDGLVARGAVALAEQRLAPDLATAQSQILQDLTRIRDVFAGLSEKLDLIDRFSHKLERRIATTVRYQETARNIREERLREAIRLAFAQWNSGNTECVTPLVDIPVPYSTATLALPKKAREPVEPQTRRPKAIDPADVLREHMIDTYVASMDVTPYVVAERLRTLTTTDAFYDLDEFEPENARDVALLYEMRVDGLKSIPGFEVRKGTTEKPNRYVSGPSLLVRRKEGAR
jgi:hypothetical protein